MKTNVVTLLLFCFAVYLNAQFNYPATPVKAVIDNYNGVKITDNYRWLEDMKNPEVTNWFKNQADFSKNYIEKISGRDQLFNDMKYLDELKDADYYNVKKSGNNYFYTKILRGEKVAKLYMRDGSGNEILIFDPENYVAGKTYEIQDFSTNIDGSILAMGLAESGAEIGESRFIDIKTKKLLPDVLTPVWGGISSWTPDQKSVLYIKLQNADNTSNDMLRDMRAMQHFLGTATSKDIEIASRLKNPSLPIKPENWVSTYFSDDYRYMFLDIGSVQREQLVYYAPASEFGKSSINWKPFIGFDDEITDFSIIGDKVFFLTHKNAPNFKIGVTSMSKPDFKNAKIVVPEGKNLITRITATKNYLVYRVANGMNIDLYQIDGNSLALNKIPLPQGSNAMLPLNSREGDEAVAVNYGWLNPYVFYNVQLKDNKVEVSKLFNTKAVYPNQGEFVVKEIEIKSYDGTMVPLSIIYPKNIKIDGSNSLYLDGYGSYGVSMFPYFSEANYALLRQNVIVAVAHVRGGGEKGEAWHKAAFKGTKENTWKDFIACADYLVNNKYTSKDKLIGSGMSAGGILIGNAVAERPDLFAAIIAEVGCTNMLRMEITPNGPNQIPEFGALGNPEELKGLIAMDAQHKIKENVKYPAVLVRTGINDPRVIPWMPAKFAATMQNSSTSGKPVLFYVDYENGHFTQDKNVTYRNYADMYAFALAQTNHPNFKYIK
ncbi:MULTISPECIES: prolyl oligopeptidase family serine peptidase [unclassified Kaistella]|uniref:prolyl oligopeptidase family serine peptidase n=1 Tax=unclassified Kaistella TaxID=2762626 RepID=UPI0027369615|nr:MULTISPECIES: prolyl oligopeptidase family serine peptidase [unclassified Kaistella]MCZ2084893.1 prolyl oligopeptidase family serine peptidase [Flavobacteriales bacterium]MDP2452592.1 prolyl oligopeptidase family serine peptidase [Kaistella sp. SH11-4b]MDP2455500.1 prolyl oligopeptidase family serine peptidase [Kaistella sp. SH40-3]MDP2458404.1 prolyl oligopeptidase family serine peptidase [Kaistella sp. SH19-2b]